MQTSYFINREALDIPAFHPGEFLLEEIEERGLVKKEVARFLGIQPGYLSEIFAGKRNLSARTAVRLEKLLGIRADYWAGLQSAWELQQARALEAV